MPARHRVPLKYKPQLLERDGHACVYCGETTPDKLTIDHLIPKILGGTDDFWNLAIACATCNGSKFIRVDQRTFEILFRNVRIALEEAAR